MFSHLHKLRCSVRLLCGSVELIFRWKLFCANHWCRLQVLHVKFQFTEQTS